MRKMFGIIREELLGRNGDFPQETRTVGIENLECRRKRVPAQVHKLLLEN
jgi:hypothetical protein